MNVRNPLDIDEPPEKKNCSVHNNGSGTAMENETKKQNKEFYEIRTILKTNTKKEDRVAILKFNNQHVPTENAEVKIMKNYQLI